MTTATSVRLDMRGKTITTYIAYEAARRLAGMADGEALEMLADESEGIDNDLRAWCRTRGQELSPGSRIDGGRQYLITKRPMRESGKRYAAVISNAGLEELLSPLSFALAAALEGHEVSLFFQGPAVRVLARGFTESLHGMSRPFSRFARSGLAKAGHVPAQEKVRQLQALGARLYACGGSMDHFKVARADLVFNDVTIAEYLTFMDTMARADVNVFAQ